MAKSISRLLVIVFIASRLACICAQEVPEMIPIQGKIEAEVQEKVEKPHEALVKDLRTRFGAAIDRELATAEKAGRTDEALALKQEKANLEADKPVPTTDDEKTPLSLKKLRATYRIALLKLDAERLKRLKPYIEAMGREAETIAVQRTKQSRLADVEAVRFASTSFAMKFSPAAVIGVGGVVLPFENGSKSYTNRFFLWESVPEALSGLRFVQTTGGLPAACEVKVKEPGAVYVAVFADNATDAETLKKLGFVKLPMAFSANDSGKTPMSVWGKVAERSISLPPSNAWSGFVVIGDIR